MLNADTAGWALTEDYTTVDLALSEDPAIITTQLRMLEQATNAMIRMGLSITPVSCPKDVVLRYYEEKKQQLSPSSSTNDVGMDKQDCRVANVEEFIKDIQ